ARQRRRGAPDIENVLMAQVTGKLAEWVLE
ncbi:hypothetical protein, partial [Pseudomonas aeruginosa]